MTEIQIPAAAPEPEDSGRPQRGDAEIARLKTLVLLVTDAAGVLLRAIRRPDAGDACEICRAPMGEKHKADCAAWPLILARHEAMTGEVTEQITETPPPAQGALI